MHNIEDYELLLSLGYELFPLAKPLTAASKVPNEAGWQNKKYDILKYARSGHAAGVRLSELDVVLDIDPRHGGKLEDAGDVSTFPVVETPGGGWHVYARLPRPMALRGKLKDGIDIKKLGGYVVAPGSERNDGRMYEWSLAHGSMPPPIVPDSMLKLIVAAEPAAGSEGEVDRWSPGELAEALDRLDPTDFRGNDAWLRIMMAAHEATGGAGRDVFMRWSARDELYAGCEGENLSRWRSLRSGKAGSVGIGTLVKILAEHGADLPAAVTARRAAGDFEEVSTSSPVIELPKSDLKVMCEKYKAVDEYGKLRIFFQREDDILGRRYWVRYTRKDFLEVCKSVEHMKKIECGAKASGEPRYEDIGQHWLDCYHKKETYGGIAFAPEQKPREKTTDGRLNLWAGFAVEPSASGTWDYLKELTFESLCGGDAESYEYVLNWLARAVQKPGETGGVAVVFRGKKGTGKGTLGRAFVRLFGQHGMHVTSPQLLTGRFNAHLRDCAALFADEAFWAGDKAGEGVLKGLVTEPAITYEGKGQNAEMGRNCVHIVMASNSDWVVPAGMDNERRFAVFDVTDVEHDRAYWHRLNSELYKDGGLGAMLGELLERDLSRFDVFRVPLTEALAEQKMQSMSPIEAWLYELVENEWDGIERLENGAVLCETLYQDFLLYCARRGLREKESRSTQTQLGLTLKKLLPTSEKGRQLLPTLGRQRYVWRLPSAADALESLNRMLGKVGK